MTVRQTGDDDGARAGTESSTGHGQDVERSVPERSRTLSNGELSRDKAGPRPGGPGGPGSLQYASTVPNGAIQSMLNQFGNNSNISRMGASRSEDGHSTSRLYYDYETGGQRTMTNNVNVNPVPNQTPAPQSTATVCAACGSMVTGQFVRALGVVFHKACFTCNVSTRPYGVHTLLTHFHHTGLSLSGRPKVLPSRWS
jgi:hypothetical protein